MDLRPIYSDDISRECRDYAAKCKDDKDRRVNMDGWRALAVADLVDALQVAEGPTKWVRMNHYQTLSIFAFDQRELPRQHPQLIVSCGRFGEVNLTQIQYRLPVEHDPWEWASTYGCNVTDLMKLVLDGFARCESRREHLVIPE